MLVALGILFPQIFHLIPNGGTLFSPMHLPVLLCGLVCGTLMGAIAGFLVPFLSMLIFQMPPFPMPFIPMAAELIAYGCLSGLFMQIFTKIDKTRKIAYIPSLIAAMIGGRIVFVAVRVLCLAIIMPTFSFGVVLAESLLSAFINTWAGIVLQIVVIPLCMAALQRAHILEKYPYCEKLLAAEDSAI